MARTPLQDSASAQFYITLNQVDFLAVFDQMQSIP
jgi:cyclophilin family peptidyl-prolyl cis-trans isomerase